MANVAFVINSLQMGGGEKLVVDIINNWKDEDKIYLILLSGGKMLLPQISNKRTIVKIIDSNYNLKNILALTKYFKENDIKYGFSHLERANKISLISAKLSKVKIFPVVHSTNIYPKGGMKEYIAKILYKFCSLKIVAISESVKSYLTEVLELPPEKVIVIRNGIDFSRINPEYSDGHIKDQKNFFTLGRFVDAKGYDILIKALNNPDVLKHNWHLKMIGDGKLYSHISRLIKINNLEDRITLLGSKTEPFQYISSADIAIMPSRREGLPISLIEILSQGIPVISSNIESLSSMVKDGQNGFHFEKDNVPDLTQKILKMLKLSPEELAVFAISARESASTFGIENTLDKYYQLLRQ
ncbi:glycosyltransferase involved in cell wall biosynthesis [Christiangramia gaetbulicola]|uniref:Glycosyltransferase involved in cell wall biosynthesis n=1 Tax=Christiangramia gaetbulicola TaxID=703340 RepID=A0A2T6AKY2_9FLAO|nr:glycosyltransferase [Christiangramia gaetbulicola]PTX44483.1 glycosyltransferase involved in cell wall biosynthesis [Christiangramia gaetbulicola]